MYHGSDRFKNRRMYDEPPQTMYSSHQSFGHRKMALILVSKSKFWDPIKCTLWRGVMKGSTFNCFVAKAGTHRHERKGGFSLSKISPNPLLHVFISY